MPDYRYVREYDTVYPDELTEHGSLVATFGLDHEWPEAPADGRWVRVEDAPALPAASAETVPVHDSALD